MEYFAKFYYTIPIQILLNFVFIGYCIRHYSKLEEIKILFYYSIVSLCQSFFGIYVSVYFIQTSTIKELIHNSINIFILLELPSFYLFIIKSTSSSISKKILKTILLSFIILTLLYWGTSNSFNKNPSLLTLAEGYLIILACFIYYLEIFRKPLKDKLTHNSNFWIISGMFLLFAFLISLFIQAKNNLLTHLNIYNLVYIIVFIGYITLFSFFIIGLKWKIRK